MNLNNDQNTINQEIDRVIEELRKKVAELEAIVKGGTTQTVYVSSTSGGSPTLKLTIKEGIVK